MDRIAIVGSHGHAKVVIDIVESQGLYRIAGLVDRFREVGEETSGYPVLGGDDDLPALAGRLSLTGFLVAVGDNFVRAQLTDALQARSPGLRLVSAVHPSAVLARGVEPGAGTVVMAGASIGPGCQIGRGCILNTHSSLDHDSRLDDFASLAPRAVTGGHCKIAHHAAIGIGATLSHRVRVGAHSVVGAGATVLGPIESYQVAYGTPARAVRPRRAGERYL